MTKEEYIAALEKIKEMHAKVGDAIGWLLGQSKGDYFKAKKMPQRIITLRKNTTR